MDSKQLQDRRDYSTRRFGTPDGFWDYVRRVRGGERRGRDPTPPRVSGVEQKDDDDVIEIRIRHRSPAPRSEQRIFEGESRVLPQGWSRYRMGRANEAGPEKRSECTCNKGEGGRKRC